MLTTRNGRKHINLRLAFNKPQQPALLRPRWRISATTGAIKRQTRAYVRSEQRRVVTIIQYRCDGVEVGSTTLEMMTSHITHSRSYDVINSRDVYDIKAQLVAVSLPPSHTHAASEWLGWFRPARLFTQSVSRMFRARPIDLEPRLNAPTMHPQSRPPLKSVLRSSQLIKRTIRTYQPKARCDT